MFLTLLAFITWLHHKGETDAVLQGANAGVNLPDAEAYAGGFEFGAPRNPSDGGPTPLVRGSSLSRGFALPVQGPGIPHCLSQMCLSCHISTQTVQHAAMLPCTLQ